MTRPSSVFPIRRPLAAINVVWWSGNVFARTGCQPDGTSCLTGNCTNAGGSTSACPAGVGGSQPASLAEFTLQSTATDFYDISVINGANIGMQFGPISGSRAAAGSGQYWCTTPGQGCSYDFGQFTRSVPLPSASHPTDYTAALALTETACTVGTGNPRAGQPPTGCPAFVDPQGVAYSCSGGANSHNGVCHKTCSSDSQCPSGLHCLEAGDGNSYCQCAAQSDCAAGQFCGTQLVPGLGASGAFSPQVYLQQCGDFEGWWTADTMCGNVNNIVGAPGNPILNCRAGITDGNGATTNLASLLECATFSSSAPGGVAGDHANASSCYNTGATAGCCGCATDSSNPLSDEWPAATGRCVNNNPTWASQAQPLIAILKEGCPSAYSYPYDDFTSTFQCRGQGSTNQLGYAITFTDLPPPSK